MITLDTLDEVWWPQARLYIMMLFRMGVSQSASLASCLSAGMSNLHLIVEEEEVIAMAITGLTGPLSSLLLIDYLAVREDHRGQGIGLSLVEELKSWAKSAHGHRLSGMIVEVESEDTPENRQRILFWEKSGFTITEYVHTYIWVPEPYQAMYMKLDERRTRLSYGWSIAV